MDMVRGGEGRGAIRRDGMGWDERGRKGRKVY